MQHLRPNESDTMEVDVASPKMSLQPSTEVIKNEPQGDMLDWLLTTGALETPGYTKRLDTYFEDTSDFDVSPPSSVFDDIGISSSSLPTGIAYGRRFSDSSIIDMPGFVHSSPNNNPPPTTTTQGFGQPFLKESMSTTTTFSSSSDWSNSSSSSSRSSSSSPGTRPSSSENPQQPGLPLPKPRQRPRMRQRALSVGEKDNRAKRRLERNRESARMCRQRRNDYLNKVEARVVALEEENRRLRAFETQNDAHEDRKRKCNAIEVNWIQRIRDATTGHQDDDKGLENILTEFQRLVLSQDVVDIRRLLAQLELAVVPNGLTRTTCGVLIGGNCSSANDSRIQEILTELQLSDEQQRALVDKPMRMLKLQANCQRSMQMLASVRTNIEAGVKSLDVEMKAVLKILTPEQSAKFMLWAHHETTTNTGSQGETRLYTKDAWTK